MVARAAAPSCGACGPQLTCPAIPSCVCAGAGGYVAEPSCWGVVAAYSSAALIVGLTAGAALALAWQKRQVTPPGETTTDASSDEAARAQALAIKQKRSAARA